MTTPFHVVAYDLLDYDDLNRLTTAMLDGPDAAADYLNTYTYGTVGGTPPVTGGPQAVTRVDNSEGADWSYDYDARGNLDGKYEGETLTHDYTFDVENRLESVRTGNKTMSFAYDADGQRVMTTREGDGAIVYTPFPDYEVEVPATGPATIRTTYRIAGQIVAIQFKIGTQTGEFNCTYTDHLGSVAALSTIAGAYISTSLARYDPFGNYRTLPSGVNPSRTSHGFTGHKHNNTGGYPTQNVGLIYMNARYYLPEVGRFISPDTIVPVPSNPQSYNRYSYVHNSPMNFTDPTGHCAEPATFTICAAGTVAFGPIVVVGAVVVGVGVVVADIASPTFNPGADAIAFLESVTQQIGNQVTHLLSESKSPKPLTGDEQKQIGKIDQIPGWLDKHPDLADDAEKVANGETLPKGRDHVKEAKERIGSLDTAIEHLSRVRRSRDAEGQAEIDAALERAREYRQQLVDVVGEPE